MRSWTTNEMVQARWLENSSFALAIEGMLQVLRVEVVKVPKKRRYAMLRVQQHCATRWRPTIDHLHPCSLPWLSSLVEILLRFFLV
jgi:hypothetical protein